MKAFARLYLFRLIFYLPGLSIPHCIIVQMAGAKNKNRPKGGLIS